MCSLFTFCFTRPAGRLKSPRSNFSKMSDSNEIYSPSPIKRKAKKSLLSHPLFTSSPALLGTRASNKSTASASSTTTSTTSSRRSLHFHNDKEEVQQQQEESSSSDDDNYNDDQHMVESSGNSNSDNETSSTRELQLELRQLKAELRETKEQLKETKEELAATKEEVKTVKERRKRKKVVVRSSTSNLIKASYKNIDEEWDVSINEKPFSNNNVNISKRVKEFAIGLDASISEEEANESISTYFTSLKYYAKRKRENPTLCSDANKKQRKRQKLIKRREAMKKKKSWDEKLKARVEKVLTIDFMSSEDDKEDHFEIRPLRWRSRKCDDRFEELDNKASLLITKKGKRQTVSRKYGPFSGRPVPETLKDDQLWAVRKT